MSANVDLRQLAVRRNGEAPRPSTRPRRQLLTRYVLPGVVLLGFLGVIAWATRDSLLSSKPVTVVPVMTTRAEVQQEGTPLFQAAGWVEPRPTPVLVTALAEGVIDKLKVVEGEQVSKGQEIALLIEEDARIALRSAQADLELRQAEQESAGAALAAAKTNAASPVHLQAALGEAESTLAQKKTEQAAIPFQLEAALAKQSQAQRSYAGKIDAAGSFPEIVVQQAKTELDAVKAVVRELEARKGRLSDEVSAQEQRRDALKQRLTLKTDETRALREAEAQVKVAKARLQQAQATLDATQLRLDRMVVKAPMSGRVLAVVARPGMRVMGLTPGSLHDSSTVVTLYDPAQLQVRADVRLEDVPRVLPRQKVKIETPAAPGGPLDGEVLFSTSIADIQKNTLQVKVMVKDPPHTLRPEMLVQVTFLAPPTPKSKDTPSEVTRLLVPRNLVDSSEGGPSVWVADQVAGVARKKSVKLGVLAGDLVEVVEGLTVTDRLIVGGREGLKDGERIKITGEDTTSGNTGLSKPARVPAKDKGHKGKH